MAKLRPTIKVYVCIMIVSLLLIHEPANKLVEGQLEAVGAVLSVVPVTSILATAGLVGVKLAALSRLLDMLGYDRAYMAQGGSGTAAHPIGLKTKYAYMFPYVPGVNISVHGEDSIGMEDTKVEPIIPQRKTYPAMGLPGNYEHQKKPFRGSDTLQKILQQAGVKVHSPSIQQQQQLQQQFHLSPEGNHRQPQVKQQQHFTPQPPPNPSLTGFDNIDPNLEPKNHNIIQPTHKEPIHTDQQTNNNNNNNNNNNRNGNNNNMNPNTNLNQNAHSSSFQSDVHQPQTARPLHSIPSNLAPHRGGDNNRSPPDSAPQQVNAQSSSSSHTHLDFNSNSSRNNNNNNNRVNPANAANQVIIAPHPFTSHTHPTYHVNPTTQSPAPPTQTGWPLSPAAPPIAALPGSPPTTPQSPSPSSPSMAQTTPDTAPTPAPWMPWLAPSISASLWSPSTQSTPSPPPPPSSPSSPPSPLPSSSSSWLPSSISASVWSPPSAPPPPPPSPSTQNELSPRTDESRPSLSGHHHGTHAIIPQREESIRQLMELRRQHQQGGGAENLFQGHLLRPSSVESIIEPGLVTAAPRQQPFSTIEFFPSTIPASLRQTPTQNPAQAHTHATTQQQQQPNSLSPPESHARIPQNNRNQFQNSHHNQQQQQQRHEALPQPPLRPSSAVPNSLKPHEGERGGSGGGGGNNHSPQWLDEQLQPTMSTVPDRHGNGFSGPPHETTTNFVPRPFDLGDFPSTNSDDDIYNEIDRMQQNGRRRKRSAAASTNVLSSHQTDLSSQSDQSQQIDTVAPGQTQASNPQQHAPLLPQTFGMPALNIHSLKRRRRYSITEPGILEEKLYNRSGRKRRHELANVLTAGSDAV